MSTPLVVETGLGIAGANSYASVEQADAFLDIEGAAGWLLTTTAEKTRLLQLASRMIDQQVTFIGTAKLVTTQGLDCPTLEMTPIEFDIVRRACIYLAADIGTGAYSGTSVDVSSISLPNFSVTTRSTSIGTRFTPRVDRYLELVTLRGTGSCHFITRI